MKLSLVFELLLIFVLLAFAASKSVKKHSNRKSIQTRQDDDKLEENSINKYCKCVEAYCNCCRDFQVPLVNLNGPGCASLMYLNGDKMSVSLSFGKKVITNRTLSSKKPSPVCMPLPGGISKFCGRVYNIARAGEEFRACLGLELQSKSTVEAAVRVSCFKFGPRGVTSEPADPLPLVPQDEKNDDDDDDDDDDEDDFGLGDDEDDDDDDDDDDTELDAVNDVDGGDYTGFSLLGEDLLGDFFGSSGSKPKKTNNKNKKKQAPAPTTTTTTTTKRPRRPTRRPNRSTTTRPSVTRTTTVKIRPVSRRPTRRPANRRPSRRPTRTTTEAFITSMFTTTPKAMTPEVIMASSSLQTTERTPIVQSTSNGDTFEPVLGVSSTMPVTTPKAVTNFEDPGLEMSLAHITGQLSVMPVTPMVAAHDAKESNIITENKVNYEKVQTITPKAPSTAAFSATSAEAVNDDMIQIVQSLDSQSEENIAEKEPVVADESRAHFLNYANGAVLPNDFYGGIQIPKKKQRHEEFQLVDLDVLDLTQIGMSMGDHLGIFGGNKRQNRHNNKDTKIKGSKDNADYVDMIEDFTDQFDFMKKSDSNKNKKDRRRQNKMMREWSSA